MVLFAGLGIDGFNIGFNIKLFNKGLLEGLAGIPIGRMPNPGLNKLCALLSKLFCDNNKLFLSKSLLF